MTCGGSGPRNGGAGRAGPFAVVAIVLTAALAAVLLPPPRGPSPDASRQARRRPGAPRSSARASSTSRSGAGISRSGIGPDRWTINVLVADPSRTRLGLGRAARQGRRARRRRARSSGGLGALAGVERRLLPDRGPLPGRAGGDRHPGRQGPQRALPQEARPGRVQPGPTDAAGRRRRRPPGRGRRREIGPTPDRRHQPAPPRRRAHPVHARVRPDHPDRAERGRGRRRERARRGGPGRRGATRPSRRGGAVLSAHGAGAPPGSGPTFQRGARVESEDRRAASIPGPASPRNSSSAAGRASSGRRAVAAAVDPGIYEPGFAEARHPRTAVGVRADGRILLVTVDGRQPERSVGMTIAELAALLLELGAVEAINMDGGGSTTMVVRGTGRQQPLRPHRRAPRRRRPPPLRR
ncbi:MAG: phosphodiester glycosidase family protein [Candidatus Moduliflexus flocculans]|nr:phosphodiester glycosidase family protein [Candidatus Moduliflexus flocculans]